MCKSVFIKLILYFISEKQKREKRRAEENFRRLKANENWTVIKSKLSKYILDCNTQQKKYLTKKFTSCNGNIKKIYKLIDDLSKCNTKSLPNPE